MLVGVDDRLARAGYPGRSVDFGMCGQLVGRVLDGRQEAVRRCRIALRNVGDDFEEVGAGFSAPDERPHASSRR